MNFIPSEEQIVYVLTKPIAAATFSSLRHKLRVLSFTAVVDCQQDSDYELLSLLSWLVVPTAELCSVSAAGLLKLVTSSLSLPMHIY